MATPHPRPTPRAPAPTPVIPPPNFVSRPAPPSSFRRRPESRGAVGVGQPPMARHPGHRRPSRPPRAPAPQFVIPAPHFVIPAKAGIQRGGEGVATPHPTTNHGQQAGPPFVNSSFRPPTSSFRRRPESRGAAGNGAIPRPPPVDPPNFNPIRISLKVPIKSSNDLAETPKGREAGMRLTYNSVRSSLIK